MKLKKFLSVLMSLAIMTATTLFFGTGASAQVLELVNDSNANTLKVYILKDWNDKYIGYTGVMFKIPAADYLAYKNACESGKKAGIYIDLVTGGYYFSVEFSNNDDPEKFICGSGEDKDGGKYFTSDDRVCFYDSEDNMFVRLFYSSDSKNVQPFNQNLITYVYDYYILADGYLIGGDGAIHKGDYYHNTSTDISSFTFSKIANKPYTGKAIKPSVTVKDGDKKLVKGTDYTVSYKNNTKIGTATVIVTGKGKYSGTKELTFNIVPKKTKISIDEVSKSKAVINWKQSKGADGYEIWCSTNGESYTKLSTIKSAKTLTKTISKLNTQKNVYKFRVRPYAKVNGKTVYGSWSNIVSAG